MSAPKGYSSQEKEDRLSAQFQTIEPVRTMQFGSSVVAHEFVYEVGTDAAEAGSTASVIVATAHSALRGDVIRLTSGALSGREVKVWSVATNSITLAETLPSAVAAAVTFQILRHKYPTVDSSGALITLATEVATAADGGALPALTKVVSGYDGAAVQVLKTDANGELQIDVLSSALPSGAATEAKQDSAIALLTTIDSDTSVLASAVSGSEMQVDVISSALPAGAATEATLATLSTSANQTNGTQKSQIVDGAGDVVDVVLLSTNLQGTDKALVTNTVIHGLSTAGGGTYIDVKVAPSGALTTETTLAGLDPAVLGQDTMANSLPVVIASDQTAIPASQSGTWNINNISGSIPLPTGAATETTLDAVKTAVELIDNAISGNEMQVDVVSSALPTGAATESTLASVEADTSALAGCVSGTEVQVDVVSSALPTGAATETTLVNISNFNQTVAGAVVGNRMQVDVIASLPSGTNNIGDVDIASALPAGTNTIGKVDVNTLSVIDLLDAGILDTSSTNIPGSASNPVQVVAATAASTKKLQLLDTTGAFIGVYTGAALSEVLQFVMGPGSDQTIEHSIPAGTRISLKRLDSTTAVSSGIVAINLIG